MSRGWQGFRRSRGGRRVRHGGSFRALFRFRRRSEIRHGCRRLVGLRVWTLVALIPLIAPVSAVARISLIALIPGTTVPLRIALVTITIAVVALIAALVPLTAVLLLLRWLGRALARDFLHWTLEAAQLLVKSFDLAFVGGLLPRAVRGVRQVGRGIRAANG